MFEGPRVVPHFITFANEKGGTGKSTTAVHSAVALAAQGRKVAALDLDTRQRTLGRYLDNRAATMKRQGLDLPMPAYATFDPGRDQSLEAAIERVGRDAEILVIDTPGRDDPFSRAAMVRADTLVTPINDSFVDLDLIGEVDAETYRVRRPSFYAELVWNSRTQRAKERGASVDWVVLRNRMQHIEARNMRRVGEALGELARRVGFRIIPGLGERVIYRELFPKGLTLLDLNEIEDVAISHIAARQELREMIAGFALPEPGGARRRAAPGGDGAADGQDHCRAGPRGPDLHVVAAAGGGARADARRRGARAARRRRGRQPRRHPRRAPPADRQGPSRRRRLGRPRDPGQRRARRLDRGAEAPVSHVFHPSSPARI